MNQQPLNSSCPFSTVNYNFFFSPSYISLWWLRYTGLTVMWLNQIKSTNWVTFAIMITAAEATPKRFYRMFRCSLKQFAPQKSDWGCVWTLIKNLIKCVADCLCYPDGDGEQWMLVSCRSAHVHELQRKKVVKELFFIFYVCSSLIRMYFRGNWMYLFYCCNCCHTYI